MNRPNTFLVGAPKCGTTAIASYLNDHPSVFLPYPKEPSFWSFDLKPGQASLKIDSVEGYLSIYKKAKSSQKVLLDASTSYFHSENAVQEILNFSPDARFIVMLRNPVDVAYAFHMEQVFNTFEDEKSFEKAWNLQDIRRIGKMIPSRCVEPKNLQYRQVAALGSHLIRLKGLLREDQLHIIFHEDFARNPRATYLSLLSFLNLEDDGRHHFEIIASAHYNKYPWLATFYQNPPKQIRFLVRGVKRLLSVYTNRDTLEWIKSWLIRRSPRPQLDPNFRALLVKEFNSEVSMIETITHRDLSSWRA